MPPRVLPRAEHNVSRKNIDEEALKVLYRLKKYGFKAYLVGGGVRDLLLGRQPKDFDISTDAHPQQVKRLFRNCFIVGRRFRLCHVRFGQKVVEVSTFRSQSEPDEGDTLIRRDNTFGTPEQDAFRRDFTVNALFYDIASFSLIDYVGGLEDLEARVIRTIGDPGVRFREDPVRMLRAVALAARLGFTIDQDTVEAIRFLRGEIVKAAPPRVLEELYKALRQGAARRTLELLHEHGLLAYVLPPADAALAADGAALRASLQCLDDYRNAGHTGAEELPNALLLGTLLVPLGVSLRRTAASAHPGFRDQQRGAPEDLARELQVLGLEEPEEAAEALPELPLPLALPFARRDVDRLRLILTTQKRLADVEAPLSARRALASRTYFEDALRWLDVHGGPAGRSLAERWRREELGAVPEPDAEGTAEGLEEASALAPAAEPAGRRRKRRRRRRGGRGPRREPEPPPPDA